MDISVVIPAFNEEKYIERCLKSLQRQQFGGNYEVIVSDDSSTDGTVKIAEKLADRVIAHPKTTISQGRQVGAEASKYDVIAFTDADTFIPPNWLSSLASSLEDGRAAGVHGNLMPLDGNRLESDFCRYVLPPYSKLMVRIIS
jgi:glycosyltransferase involved in cell wall biosynthesis